MLDIPDSMFDFKAYYSRIAEQLPHDAVIAEVGVADGASAIWLADTLYHLGKSFKLYMIDNLDYGHSDQLCTIMNNVLKSGVGHLIEVMPYDSLNASCRFPDNHFDFVFIDASHRYEFTKADIRLWYRKVKEGCILAGHDYNDQEGAEVLMAVNEVIPTNEMHYEETDKGYGLWWIKKYNDVQMA